MVSEVKISSSSRDNQPHLYNPFTDQIASVDIHIDGSNIMGENRTSNFIVSVIEGFYTATSILVQTMCMLKGQAEGTLSKQVIDLKPIYFSHCF